MFRRCFLQSLTVVALIAGGVHALASVATAEGVAIDDVQVGLDGMVRPGVWTRLRVKLSTTGSIDDSVRVVLRTSDPGGNQVTFPSRSHDLLPSVVDLFFKAGRLDSTLVVETVVGDGQVTDTRKIALSESESDDPAAVRTLRNDVPAWIVVGPLPGGPGLAANPDRDAVAKLRRRGVHLTMLQSEAELPLAPQALPAWDAVILSGKFDISPERSESLKTWVGNGGHLILAIGTHSDELLASSLSDWALAGQTVRNSSISDLSGLELLVSSYADQQGGGIPLEDRRIPFFNPRPGVTIESTDGRVLTPGGLDGVVLTRHSYGFGRVTLLGIDLDEPPMSRWRGLDSFLTSIVDTPLPTSSQGNKATRISHTGITELATQLQTSMEDFDAVPERSTLSILGFTLLYLLIIGPLDWLLVHRVLKRPGLTWTTFPGVILLAVFLAGSSAQSSNGSELRVNSLEIVDIDSVSGHGRQHVWTSIFSPSNRRTRVGMVSTGVLGDGDAPRLSWSGIPEAYFGGMYRGAGLEYGRPAYSMSDPSSEVAGIDNLPIPIWSDRVLAAESEFVPSADLFTTDLKRGGSGRLTPGSSFSHNLPFPIRDWLLADSSHIYYYRPQGGSGDLMQAGTLEPGVTWTPSNPDVGLQALRGYLTGSRFQVVNEATTGTEYATTQSKWDSSNTDMTAIVRMLTLHEMSGGSDYTGLKNSVLSHLELSDCLPLDRVILIGRIDAACSGLLIDGDDITPDRHDTFIRVLLPVAKGEIGELPDFDKNKQQ